MVIFFFLFLRQYHQFSSCTDSSVTLYKLSELDKSRRNSVMKQILGCLVVIWLAVNFGSAVVNEVQCQFIFDVVLFLHEMKRCACRQVCQGLLEG